MPEVTNPSDRIEELDEKQKRAILQAYRLSGPSGDYLAADLGEDEALDSDIAHPMTGRLTELGVEIRRHLIRACYRAPRV